MTTQNAKLLNWLERHDGATTAEVTANLKIYRLSERIRELEALGYRISHTPETTSTGARVIRYRLIGAPKASSAPKIDNTLDHIITHPFVGTIPASAAPDAVMVEYSHKSGRPLRFMVSGYGNGRPVR